MLRDQQLYLPDDILVKVDRASMAVGLEMRPPLLARSIVEWAWRQPMRCKERNGQGKWLLRELLARHVPRELFERPKMGFGIPLDDWLRGPLRDWASGLLPYSVLSDYESIEIQNIQRLWQAHLAGHISAGYLLWNLLMPIQWRHHWGV